MMNAALRWPAPRSATFPSVRAVRSKDCAWLARTAVHEAFKLVRHARREVPLDVVIERASPVSPHGLVARRERLAGIGALPERQQRVLWLHALGLSYTEIAVREGCTTRTVERQLLRARQRLRDADRLSGPA